MIDPYVVLGVSRNATEDEIKKAYRKKAKEYHPDLHPDDPVAAQKMNEVNEAYDMLKNPEKYERKRAQEQAYSQQRARQQQNSYYGNANRYNGYNQNSYNQNSYNQNDYNQNRYENGGFYSGFGGFNFEDFFSGFGSAQRFDTAPHARESDPPDLVRAINAVNSGRYHEAISILSAMTSGTRNARWHYVMAVAYHGIGDHEHALEQIRQAAQEDPNNRIYQQLYNTYSQMETGSTENYYRRSSGFSILRFVGLGLLLMFIMRFLFSCMFFRF